MLFGVGMSAVGPFGQDESMNDQMNIRSIFNHVFQCQLRFCFPFFHIMLALLLCVKRCRSVVFVHRLCGAVGVCLCVTVTCDRMVVVRVMSMCIFVVFNCVVLARKTVTSDPLHQCDANHRSAPCVVLQGGKQRAYLSLQLFLAVCNCSISLMRSSWCVADVRSCL